MDSSAVIVRSEHVTWKKMGEDKGILLDLNTGRYYVLNETATAAWKLMVSGKPLGDIVAHVGSSFDGVGARAADDVEQLVRSLLDRGLVSVTDGQPASGGESAEDAPSVEDPTRPYVQPEVEEREAMVAVTGTAVGDDDGSCHYWYPN